MAQPEKTPVTWLLLLTALDDVFARFHAPDGTTLELPRDEWEAMQRPGSIYITPTAERRADG
jgi:hypothetical protein